MDIIKELNKLEPLQVGDIVDICDYDYAIKNNPNNIYIGHIEEVIKDAVISNIVEEDDVLWYMIEGSYYSYTIEFLIRR